MKNDIIYEVKSLFRSIHRNFFIKDENTPKPPSPTQIEIMDYMAKHQNEKIYQKDLEKVLDIRRATVSEVLKTMEKNGLLERKTNKDDLRSKEIVSTNKAKNIFKNKNKKILHIKKIVTKNISKEDMKIFIKVINQMKNNIKEDKQ